MFIVNGQGNEEIGSMINLSRSVFPRPLPCFWSGREISLRTKGRAYQAVVRSILLNGYEARPVQAPDLRIPATFNNGSIRRNLQVRRRDCIPFVEL